jgi:hypothetical protein
MPCDTKETAKDLLMDDGTRDGWCRACYMEFLRSEDVYPRGLRCHTCQVIHCEVNMIEKLEGYYCESCAEEYEKVLLEKLSGPAVPERRPDGSQENRSSTD